MMYLFEVKEMKMNYKANGSIEREKGRKVQPVFSLSQKKKLAIYSNFRNLLLLSKFPDDVSYRTS